MVDYSKINIEIAVATIMLSMFLYFLVSLIFRRKKTKLIKNVKVGDIIYSDINGLGIVVEKTKLSITVEFENGNVIKNTYSRNDIEFNGKNF